MSKNLMSPRTGNNRLSTKMIFTVAPRYQFHDSDLPQFGKGLMHDRFCTCVTLAQYQGDQIDTVAAVHAPDHIERSLLHLQDADPRLVALPVHSTLVDRRRRGPV